jgi:hypothetical protein
VIRQPFDLAKAGDLAKSGVEQPTIPRDESLEGEKEL